jgi:hypothetical protein
MIQLVSRRLLTQMPVFNSRPVYMGFVVQKVALEPVFLQVLQFSSLSVIIPLVVYGLFHLPPTLYCVILTTYTVVKKTHFKKMEEKNFGLGGLSG